jgi:hypothetical protein
MRLRLLLIVLLGIAGMGADCGGGGGSGGAATESSTFAAATEEEGQGGGDFSQPVPEPSALLVFGTGLAIAGLATRRRR